MRKAKSNFLLLISFLFFVLSSVSQVRLPKLISDGMILQRDARLKIWGWASPGEKISVRFINKTYQAATNSNGEWNLMLPELKAGGPYEMQITGSNEIIIRDILVGDVWVCSGQSNMEYAMRSSGALYASDIANSANQYIRQFAVPRRYNFNTAFNDLAGGSWQTANPETVLRFSAVAYFFAKNLYDRYKIPIGIINATLGGSRTESWMSEDALKPFSNLYEDARKYKDSTLIARIESEDRARAAAWNKLAKQTDEGYKDPAGFWYQPGINTGDWNEMKLPDYWANGKLGPLNGVVWFRKEFDVPSSMTGVQGRLLFGRIVDADSVFINGNFVGAQGSQYSTRSYAIPPSLLKPGRNVIVARIVNSSGRGGFVPGKQYKIGAGKDTIDLSGSWQYRLGSKMDPLAGATTIMWKPTGLYNGMISPLLAFAIKGVIWYQGESNISRAVEQRTLFPALIKNWRDKWQQGNFPFLFVQLPNYNEPKSEPSESEWAMFRESQQRTLSQPKTGMAVSIDVGEFNDIHPQNKKDIGIRLALAAQHVAYGDRKIVYSGPLYQSMKVQGNKIILSFNNVGKGLVAKDGGTMLNYFAIAGEDKKFVWANAEIKNNKVIVWSDKISAPVAARYAWADDPEEANLYNAEGLPASPFRTDNF